MEAAMSAFGPSDARLRQPHRCPACGRPMVQPEAWERGRNGRWRVDLCCPACDWTGEALLTEREVEAFEDELERGCLDIAVSLAEFTAQNMREYAERFTLALAVDAVLPEDF
jgi:hypothetical protein